MDGRAVASRAGPSRRALQFKAAPWLRPGGPAACSVHCVQRMHCAATKPNQAASRKRQRLEKLEMSGVRCGWLPERLSFGG